MTNYGKYELPVLIDEIQIIKESLRIILNTIFFHRWLGDNQFKDVESTISNIYYIKLDNTKIQKEIELQIENVEKCLIKKGWAQLVLHFYQQKIKQYFFGEKLDNLWESWSMFFMLEKSSHSFNNKETIIKEVKIRNYVFNAIKLLNDKYDFMPDIEEGKVDVFPYEFQLNTEFNESDLLSILKNVGSVKLKD
jgi:hypothetical protein